MSDRIDFGSEPWQAIPRRILRDPELSARAKGGLVTLLSHEEGWVRSCIAILQKECKVGRKQAQAIMAELRELGYADLIHEQGDGNLRKTHYVVRARPERAGSQADLFAAPSYPKPGGSETGRVGNGAAVVEALDVDPPDEDPQNLPPVEPARLHPRKRDEIFDALAELHGGADTLPRQMAKTIATALADIRAASPDVTPEEIHRRVNNYFHLSWNREHVPPSAMALGKWWSDCARSPHSGPMSPAEQQEAFRQVVEDQARRKAQ